MKKSNRKPAPKSITIAMISVLALILIILILLLSNSKETHITNDIENESIEALVCSAGIIEDAFFTPKNVNTVKNEIKIVFTNTKKIDGVFYSYLGIYRSYELANEEKGRFNTEYNIYMGGNNMPYNTLSPTYSAAETKAHVSLYADSLKKINNVTARFFFIDEEELNDYKNFSIEETKSFYENKGFSCQNA